MSTTALASVATKSTAATVATVLLLTILYPIAPRASAQIGTFETNPVLIGGVVTTAGASAISAESTAFDAHVRPILDGLAWTVAKVAVQSLTRSTVNWINSGFQGSPAYVTDLKQTLEEVGDTVADDFFDSLEYNSGIDVRSPFKDQVTQALRDNYYRSTAGFYGNGYDLDLYSDDPSAFLDGHFARGGFDAWFATLANDENNPLGAYRSGQNELARRVEDFRVNRLHELNWGNGFLSWRGDCIVKKPAGAPTSLKKTDDCASYEIKTPGSVIESTLGITATSPLRQLELADSINEIVGALAGQLVGQVLGGVGLSGVSQPRSGGGNSYLTDATDPNQYAQGTASLSNGFIQTVKDEQNKVEAYQKNWMKIQSAAGSARGCVDDSVIDDALARAKSALEKASTATTELNTISARISSSQSSTNSAAALSSVSDSFLTLMSSGKLISAQDATDAQVQASEDSKDSLYSQLTATCGRGS
ncbi:MAG: hypothetical protein AB202_03030 [Parcubacteria bacterium C7867-007]|nr:MAG: hypothetical protein AB202_03030 [Parcubacteria bacterium C7867-007]